MASKKSSNGNGFGTNWFTDNANDDLDGSDNLEKLWEARRELLQSFAQVTLAMMSLERYRHLSIGKLSHVLLEPMLRERVMIASESTGAENKDSALIGIAVWATVSEAVDARIRAQIRGGAFPIELGAGDWTSGNIVWILELIAPTSDLRASVLGTIAEQLHGSDLIVHPVVAQLIGRDGFEGVKVRFVNGDESDLYEEDDIVDDDWPDEDVDDDDD